jgi:hypothetical protein
VEENAIRYSAGFAVKKMLIKYELDIEAKECIAGLLIHGEVQNVDTSSMWLTTTDRGGLVHITDLAFELFIEVEIVTYNHVTKMDNESLYKKICNDADVLRIWEVCSIDIDNSDKKNTLLLDIVKIWFMVIKIWT